MYYTGFWHQLVASTNKMHMVARHKNVRGKKLSQSNFDLAMTSDLKAYFCSSLPNFMFFVPWFPFLKSSWILGEVLKKTLNSIFPWKVLKFLGKSLKSPWIFFNFEFSGMGSVFWWFLVVQDRIIMNHNPENLKVIHTKCSMFYASAQ